MPMKLRGSCRCGAVVFSVDSNTPYPYQLCYCSICRKTAGGGGFAINIMGIYKTLKIEDKSSVSVYQAEITNETDRSSSISDGEINFCNKCATTLWLWDKRWPELVHPFASVIDTELPKPPERVHILLDSKASWVEPEIRKGDKVFNGYPEDSIEEWHRKRNLWID